jgi:hypothetical protein
MGNLALSQVYLSELICEVLVDELLPDHADRRSTRPRELVESGYARTRDNSLS